MPKPMTSLDTKLIHAGEPDPRINGAVAMPIFQSSTFEYAGETNYHDIRYIRLNNTPAHDALHAKIASLEGAEAALVTSSGMAAISTTLLTLVSNGDHLLIQDCVYGGTNDFVVNDLPEFGIDYTFVDGNNPQSWREHLRPTTKAIYVETIANPLLGISDLAAAVSFAKENKILSLVDNTFASPVNFSAIDFGFDLSLHSCTKYMNGHSDIVGGAVLGNAGWIQKIRHKLNHLGGTMDPHACFLLHRGLKTLGVRVRYQNENALNVARFLESHNAVSRVYYPGLESHPQHHQACKLFKGFGGMVSFELDGGVAAAERFIDRVSLPIHAPSLGGVESLIIRPAASSHLGMTSAQRQRAGISDSLIRLSVGLEATEDLIVDFNQAFES